MLALGFLLALVVAAEKILFATSLSDRALLLLAVLLMVLGVQTLSLGLVGEILIFTHARNVREYHVAEVIRSPVELAANAANAADTDALRAS